MIPAHLSGWTLEAIRSLLAAGVFESESFDFKQMLPPKKDENGKVRLRRVCTTFANAEGGFLIFGVSDESGLNVEARLVGVDPTEELPSHFGPFAAGCTPPVEWTFLNPPVALPNGRVIHVVEVFKSQRKPHAVAEGHSLWFGTRDSSGTRHLSYQEIQMLFLNTYEKMLRLQLLQVELEALIAEADVMMKDLGHPKHNIVDGHFHLEVIESVIADTYSITHAKPELLGYLQSIRRNACAANVTIQLVRDMHGRSVTLSPIPDLSGPIGVIGTAELENRNMQLKHRVTEARDAAKKAVDILKLLIG